MTLFIIIDIHYDLFTPLSSHAQYRQVCNLCRAQVYTDRLGYCQDWFAYPWTFACKTFPCTHVIALGMVCGIYRRSWMLLHLENQHYEDLYKKINQIFSQCNLSID